MLLRFMKEFLPSLVVLYLALYAFSLVLLFAN